MRTPFLPPLEHGHPIPPATPRRAARTIRENPLRAHLRGADTGDSVLVPVYRVSEVKGHAKAIGLECRWLPAGRMDNGASGMCKAVRVWFIRH